MAYYIFYSYVICLCAVLIYVTIKEKKFFYFGFYPMFSYYKEKNQMPHIFKTYITDQNHQLKKWRVPVYYGRCFNLNFERRIRLYLEEPNKISAEILSKFIDAVLSTLPPDESRVIFIMKKSFFNNGGSLEITMDKAYRISFRPNENEQNWTITSVT